jgi:hypothetical protein
MCVCCVSLGLRVEKKRKWEDGSRGRVANGMDKIRHVEMDMACWIVSVCSNKIKKKNRQKRRYERRQNRLWGGGSLL